MEDLKLISTYADLKAQLEGLTPEQLSQPVATATINGGISLCGFWVPNEDQVLTDEGYVPLQGSGITNPFVILDKGVPYLTD